MKKSIKLAWNIAIAVFALILLVLVINFSISTLPNTGSPAYPPPTISAADQEVITETPIVDVKQPIATPEAGVANDETFFERPTQLGSVIESGYSWLPSNFLIVNQWVGNIEGFQYLIFAGAMRGDPALGGRELKKPWPGIIIIEVRGDNGTIISEQSGRYQFEGSGILRLIDADEAGLYLAGETGETYLFGIDDRSFSKLSYSSGYSRPAKFGIIYETVNVPLPSGKYNFINYLNVVEQGVLTSIYAGAESENPLQGVVVIIKQDSINTYPSSGTVFLTPIMDGPVRIIEAYDSHVILATTSGLTFAFDRKNGQFYDRLGSEYVLNEQSNALKSVPYDANGISITTDPQSVPTYTPLPTYNPYP
jgi:hypothetical protein